MTSLRFFKKPSVLIALSVLLLLIVAAAVRFYQLGQVPHGLAWDETAIGYNGFGIWEKRRDEWQVKLPISFRSFGDYKAPLAIYLNSFFTFVFGLNSWAVRLPFAVAGVASVAGMGVLVRKLTGGKNVGEDEAGPWRNAIWPLFAMALTAFSVWHIHFSRIAFESGLSLSLAIFGVWMLLSSARMSMYTIAHTTTRMTTRTAKQNKVFWKEIFVIFAAAVLLVGSMYTYHSAKIVVPLLIGFFVLHDWSLWRRKKVILTAGVLLAAILLTPMMIDTVKGAGGERFTQSSLFGLHLSSLELSGQLIQHFFAHFSPGFLWGGQTTTLRHGDGQSGIFLPTEAALLLAGVLFLGWFFCWSMLSRLRKNVLPQPLAELHVWRKLLTTSFVWFVVGILPAVIGRDVPHSNRALLALPGAIGLMVGGAACVVRLLWGEKFGQRTLHSKEQRLQILHAVIGVWLMTHTLFLVNYLHHYYTDFAAASATDFQDGYIEAMQYVREKESDVEKILFTSSYGQPYIYALFAGQIDPISYGGGALIKYLFPDHVSVADFTRTNTIIVGTPEEIDSRLGQKLIYGSDGKVRFVIVERE